MTVVDSGWDHHTQIFKALPDAFFPGSGQPFGWQDLNAWGRYAKWMSDNGLLKRLPAVGRAVTNDYLPGQGIG